MMYALKTFKCKPCIDTINTMPEMYKTSYGMMRISTMLDRCGSPAMLPSNAAALFANMVQLMSGHR